MAMNQPKYKCPLCQSSLTRERYERVLHIDEGRKAELARAEQQLAARRHELEEERRRIVAQAADRACDLFSKLIPEAFLPFVEVSYFFLQLDLSRLKKVIRPHYFFLGLSPRKTSLPGIAFSSPLS